MAEVSQNFYTSDSIKSLKGAEPYRLRPETVLGTKDENGVLHAEFEVLSNATDEVREGHSDKVIVRTFKDGAIEIQDFGRGVPMGWNEAEGKYAYELIFCTMYASGKYDASNYSRSAGLNGIGDTAAQFTSEYMDVESVRDEHKNVVFNGDGSVKSFDTVRTRYTMRFEKGYPVGELKVEEGVEQHTGTKIKFKPDLEEVFKDAQTIHFDISTYLTRLRRDSMLSGALMELHYEDMKPIEVYYPDGVKSWLDETVPVESRYTKDLLSFSGSGTGKDSETASAEEYTANYDINFGFKKYSAKVEVDDESEQSSVYEVYHNGGLLSEGGAPSEGFYDAVINVLNGYARSVGVLSRKDRFKREDLSGVLFAVVSTECPGYLTNYMNQTKVAITNRFIRKLVSEQTKKYFENWVLSHKAELDEVVQAAITAKSAREKADAVRQADLKQLSKGVDSFRSAPEKLTRCTSRKASECEIYIVEGDSAKGPIVLARDSKTQAVLPVRGKIINCITASLAEILKSDVVLALVQSIGCGVEAKSKLLKDLPQFDITKLNYDKIIICTDADDDGYHIRCLVLTVLYRLMPTIIREGKVYIAETPLFLIDTHGGKGKKATKYAYTTAEKDKLVTRLILDGVKESDILVKRLKGLGETSAAVMHTTTMDKKNRHLIRVTMENVQEFASLAESLMGTDVPSRRSLVEAYYETDFEEIAYDTEESLPKVVDADLL